MGWAHPKAAWLQPEPPAPQLLCPGQRRRPGCDSELSLAPGVAARSPGRSFGQPLEAVTDPCTGTVLGQAPGASCCPPGCSPCPLQGGIPTSTVPAAAPRAPEGCPRVPARPQSAAALLFAQQFSHFHPGDRVKAKSSADPAGKKLLVNVQKQLKKASVKNQTYLWTPAHDISH